jgi:hypothetical protein
MVAPLVVVPRTDAEFDASAIPAEIHLRGRWRRRNQGTDCRSCEEKLPHGSPPSWESNPLMQTHQRDLCFNNL